MSNSTSKAMRDAYVKQRVRMLYLLAVESVKHPLNSSFDSHELETLKEFIERFKAYMTELKPEGLTVQSLEGDASVEFFNQYKMSWREFMQCRDIRDFEPLTGEPKGSSTTLLTSDASDDKAVHGTRVTKDVAPVETEEGADSVRGQHFSTTESSTASSTASSAAQGVDHGRLTDLPAGETPSGTVTWLDLMDSHKEFCKYLPIKYRQGVGPHAEDGGSGPMFLTRVQAIASANFTKEFFMDGIPVRWQDLKSRQLCYTTFLLSIEAWLICQIPSYAILLIIDKDDHMFAKRKCFEDWFEALYEKFGDVVPRIVKREGRNLFFSNDAVMTFESAESRNPGTSMFYNFMHWSERPKWPGNKAQQIKASLLPGLPYKRHTVLIDESTAEGIDAFKADWDELHKPQSGFNKHQMRAHFYAWMLSDEYQEEPPASSYDLNGRFKYLDEDKDLCEVDSSGNIVETESEYAVKYKLTDAQVYWRRVQIKTVFKDKVLFDQEYPTTPEHAWSSIGARFVPNQVLKESLKYVKKPLFSGTIIHSESAPQSKDEHFGLINASDLVPELAPSKYGELHIYQYPVEGERYFEGGDVSEGQQVIIGNRSEGDNSSVVITNEFGAVCAVYKFKIKPDRFWLVLALLGKYYNYARLNCEYNNDGKTVWALMSKIGYPNYHWSYTASGQIEEHPWVRIKTGERVAVLNIGRLAIIEDPSRVTSMWLHEEAAALIRKDAKNVQPVSEHDDVFMAYCHSEISRREITDRMIHAAEVPNEKYEDGFANDTIGAILMNQGHDPREMFEGEPNLAQQDYEYSWYPVEWAS